MDPPVKKRRTTLSIQEKIQLLDLAKNRSNTTSTLLAQFGIGMSTFYKIQAQEKKLRAASLSNKNLNQKRNKRSSYDSVNVAVTKWFYQMRAKGATVNGPMVMEKAKELGAGMGIDFEPSNGWLQRWKSKENITFQKVHEEKGDSIVASAEQWIWEVLPRVVEGYEKSDIYNVGETGLYYKSLPRQMCAFRGDKLIASKQQKERLTALFLCNQDGTDKRVFAIGKLMKPRCFLGVRAPPLPYYSSTNAWMTSTLWTKILQEFNEQLLLQKRKVLLFAENISCHRLEKELTNIKLVLLPPNTPTQIQPLHQGIMKNAKTLYRQQIIRRQLAALDKGLTIVEFIKSVDVLQALHMLKQALNLVELSTIQHCFKKAGFDFTSGDDNADDSNLSQEDNDVVEELPPYMTIEDFEEWVMSDNDLQCYGELTDAEIIAEVQQKENAEMQNEKEQEQEPSKPTNQDVIAALDTLRSYYDTEIRQEMDEFYRVENRVMQHVQKDLIRSMISDIFTYYH